MLTEEMMNAALFETSAVYPPFVRLSLCTPEGEPDGVRWMRSTEIHSLETHWTCAEEGEERFGCCINHQLYTRATVQTMLNRLHRAEAGGAAGGETSPAATGQDETWPAPHHYTTTSQALEAAAVEPALKADAWLLVKRGLYYRPGSKGYTGIKSQAGTWSFDQACDYIGKGFDGVSMLRVASAPEYTPSCWDDLKAEDLRRKRQGMPPAAQEG